ncbi:chromosome partition protein Smc [Galliscardovia ingluviei]|uniref:Chromosome partition protein Smc n=1 Tax=Galliscardovia ingluviei TaxID=1769422 RepID=A0A8J3EX85_9BIFI|nr:chromosome partition protein Smc [Galliscardovia ingluviei]
MYLKELTLKGFKSFAQPTVLRFEPGITAIVGPNGSGKSNVVDALAWVMGEQGARSLRGSQMDDVIFAGTSSKPALGRAEVSLTIDNSDHTLDIEYTEVTITRTLFRNSGSQYAINGTPCRLLDVQELLNDAGLGAHMHVIVGQGRLDAILHADPQGHRALIEEAAGILKHRRRKERALRKLDAAADNIQRLDDVLQEIHTRMGPLSRQASMSRKADMITARLHDARARLHAADAAAMQDQRQIVMQELTGVRLEHETLSGKLAVLADQIKQAEQLAQLTNPQLEQLHTVRRELDRLLERYRTLQTVATERARHHRESIVPVSQESVEPLLARVQELQTMAQHQETVISKAKLTLDQAVTSRTHHEHELARVRQAVDELQSVIQAHDAQISQLQQQYAAATAGLTQQEQRLQEANQRQEEAQAKVQSARDHIDTLQTQTRDELDEQTAATQLEQARDMLSTSRVAHTNAQHHEQEISQKIVAVQAKADAIDDTLQARDEALVQELPASLTQGEHVLGKLSSFLRVREGFEEAIALALEPLGQAFVVQSLSDIASTLQSTSARLALLAADSNTNADMDTDAQDAMHQKQQNLYNHEATYTLIEGFEPAAQLISARISEGKHAQQAQHITEAVQQLLGQTCVYTAQGQPSLAQLQAMWQRGWSRVLTTTQCWVSAHAVIQGSAGAYSDMSLIARRDQALTQVASLQQDLEQAQQEREQTQAAVAIAQAQVERLQQERNERKIQAARWKATLDGAEQALQQAQAELQTCVTRVAEQQDRVNHAQERVAVLQTALESAMQQSDNRGDPRTLQAHEREIEQKLSDARTHEQAAKQELSQAQTALESYQRQAHMLQDNAQTMQRKNEQTQQRNEQHQQVAQHLTQLASSAHHTIEQIAKDSAELEQELQRLQESSSAQQAQLRAWREQQHELSSKLTHIQQRQSTLDIERERLAIQFGQLEHAIRTDVGVSVEQAIAQYGPDQPVPVYAKDGSVSVDEHNQPLTRAFNRDEQTQEFEQATRQLARLGKINPLAVEEYDALQDRLSHLNQQRDDVINSRNDLLRLIDHLDTTMQHTFIEAFNATAYAFEEMFAVLFPGGSGKLVLDDYEHPLEAGVHVEARPAGKRVKQLSLLSGGERSLTTLALLFAIFTARPSPFYILDEVEAALDDMNLTRLLNAFEKLRESSQLLVITHQQRTMALADALVGVTMRADGVSATISQKMHNSTHNHDE